MAHRKPASDQDLPARAGDRIGHFVIESVLGRGGMGVVYLAKDTELGCKVALKCPWPRLARDPVNRRRFLREARAASKLCHPNIVQIREVFEQGELPWLVMNLVEGRSLRRMVDEEGALPVRQVLRLAEDLGSALEAAHSRNVLHRDVTPGNVIVTNGGGALLSDFGLAAFIEPPDGSAASTLMTVGSRDGEVIGTPAYRSPEQAMGKRLDVRSDIFSLGTVLYEMCTGKPAFRPTAEGDTTYAILNREPTPLGRRNYEVPEELERIIRKAMAKEPEERYQTAGDLLVDIRALRHRMEFADYLKTHPDADATRRSLVAGLVGATVAAAALLAVWFFAVRPEGGLRDPGQPLQITSSAAWEGQPMISPDGKRMAYTSDETGNLDIYVADIRGGEPLRLTDDPSSDTDPAWYPGGSHIAFTSDRGGETSIWKMGSMGGGATLLVSGASQPAVSPDGSQIAFAKRMPDGMERIGVSRLDDPGKVTVITTDDDGLWWHSDPCWSPDGRRIAYKSHQSIWMVEAAGGPARRIAAQDGRCAEPFWSSDGRSVIYSCFQGGISCLWRVSVSGGRTQRLTLGMGPESHASVSADGSRLAYTTHSTERALVIQDMRTGRRAAVTGMRELDKPALSPDGASVVFVSNKWGGDFDLWVQPLDGIEPAGSARQLTDHAGTASHPMYSPDGRWIAYYRILDERRNISVIPAAGGASLPFTDDEFNNIHPSWSPDGARLAFISERDGSSQIWIAGIEDGRRTTEPRKLATEGVQAYAPRWSPDGRTIAFCGVRGPENEIWTVPADGGGKPVQVTHGAGAFRVDWNSAPDEILVSGAWGAEEGRVWIVSLADGNPRSLEPEVSLGAAGSLAFFDASFDGAVIAFVEGTNRGDIWVLASEPGTY